MEREKFEDKLKNVFDQAEIPPSENVWRNVELDLAKSEGDLMRRRLAFFKLLAAASVIFAISVGGFSLYYLNGTIPLNTSARLQLPVTPESSSQSVLPKESPSATQSDQQIVSSPGQNEPDATVSVGDERASEKEFLAENNKPSASEAKDEPIQSERSTVLIDDGSNPASEIKRLNTSVLNALGASHDVNLVINQQTTEEDPVVLMMQRLAQREAEFAAKEEKKQSRKNQNEDLWASAGFSAGSFNQVTPGEVSGSTAGLTASSIANQEAKASGTSYSMGMNMGTRLAQRWVLQGGLNYMMQSSDYTAQTAIGSSDFTSFRPASINELEKLNLADGNTAKVVTTAPYNVNNQVRYLSLPVQAGYLVLDRKIGVQVNAGISTDLFLHNNKTAETDNIQQISQGISDDSPYRTMNFSGLVGTELSYRFAERYRVSLNPGLRYPLNSVYKSDLGIQSTPLTFDLGLRFRYIFH